MVINQDKKIPEKDTEEKKGRIKNMDMLDFKNILGTQLEIRQKFDMNGYVIIDKGYTKKKFITKPI